MIKADLLKKYEKAFDENLHITSDFDMIIRIGDGAYFDYIDDDGKKEQYDPDMDMDFIEFKEQMRMEWNARNKRKLGCCYNV